MKVIKTSIPEVMVIETDIYSDERGYFRETHHDLRYATNCIESSFVQDNLSYSKKDVLRGLHFQQESPQGKLITPIQGRIFDVAVDVRPDSQTFGQWVGIELSDNNRKQLYIPEGFAHGFCVLSDEAYVHYKCTARYNPGDEMGLKWDDPTLGIVWPVAQPIISQKDKQNMDFKSYMHKIGAT
ncbi:MAG: dTDP-4-dehydrorhamnose 3,5-epimerase [Candidatus Magnetoglobus multicellularis str. Araruama]|uniref:dTDP-4-dehydrorhamnose 3,5-epimerase n=1 Tax=Candidatus Magnetoglobus multicellularis str. Araruama TaxID=890399 RepID=A0A1V1PHI2_9BACT|nr:MAG: dTDP-4-dehydrorhamnose 3,5-epimerase [Candidatus Magnetoglobus multicellularis str. Araruama]